MDIGTFDEAGTGEATALLLTCARVPAWADAVVDSRPFGTVESLLARAGDLAAGWGRAEVDQALADHPRIGEQHRGGGAAAALSRGEQSGVDGSTDTAARLAAGNRRYEERFGRIFLIRAAGRDAEEILGHLERRLEHDDETEIAETAGQLREIALLRLEGMLR